MTLRIELPALTARYEATCEATAQERRDAGETRAGALKYKYGRLGSSVPHIKQKWGARAAWLDQSECDRIMLADELEGLQANRART
jgi:hypothetical protein